MAPSKRRVMRAIDLPAAVQGGGGIPVGTTEASLPPPPRSIPAPTGVTVSSSGVERSASTPTAYLVVSWRPVLNINLDKYEVQIAQNPAFTLNARTEVATPGSYSGVTVGNLTVNTLYYVRVRAVVRALEGEWSSPASATTPTDTAPPNPPTAVSVAFINAGDLEVRWTNPTNANFRDVEIAVYSDASKTTRWELVTNATGLWRWSATENLARTSSVGDPTVYVELRSRSFSNVFSTPVSGSATKSRPANVSGVVASWDGATGTCTFRWTAQSDAARYDLSIDGGTAKRITGTEYLYPLALNRQEHSGTPDPDLSWSLIAVDGLNQTSLTPTTGTASLPRPATPTGVTHRWTGDDGTREADWLISWNAQSGIVGFRLTIDSLAREIGLATRYSYPLLLNMQEHSGTPDPALTWALVAVDALGQTSATPASGTATNAAPPTVSLNLLGYNNQLALTIGKSAALDFYYYRVRIYRNSSLVDTLELSDERHLYASSQGSGDYYADVAVVDLFNQLSNTTTSATITVDALTIADLRADAIYSDFETTNPATLKAALADDVRNSGGITYGLSAAWIRWIRCERPLLDRYRTLTLAMEALGGTSTWYVRTSANATNWRYWAGPLTNGRVLTEVASESAAQSAPINAATLGNSGASRVDLASIVEARYFEVWIRNTGASTRVNEFYPRRLIQADDMEAEAIKAIHISAGAIIAGTIAVGALDGFMITGALIRTAASGQRVELDQNGLRTYNSAGQVQVEATTATNGELRGGQGKFRVNRDNVMWEAGTSRSDISKGYNFYATVGGAAETLYGGTRGYISGNIRTVEVNADRDDDGMATRALLSSKYAAVNAFTPSGATTGTIFINNATLQVADEGVLQVGTRASVTAIGGGGWASIGDTNRNFTPGITDWASGFTTLLLNGLDFTTIGFHDASNRVDFIRVGGGNIQLGYDAGYGSANVLVPGLSAFGGSAVGQQRVRIYSTGNTTSDFPIAVVSANGASTLFYVRGDGQVWFNGSVQTSDQRLKRDMAPLDLEAAMQDVRALQAMSYRWMHEQNDSGPLYYGFGAQQAQQVNPNFAREGMDGMLGLDSHAILSKLLAATQHIDQRLQALESTNA